MEQKKGKGVDPKNVLPALSRRTRLGVTVCLCMHVCICVCMVVYIHVCVCINIKLYVHIVLNLYRYNIKIITLINFTTPLSKMWCMGMVWRTGLFGCCRPGLWAWRVCRNQRQGVAVLRRYIVQSMIINSQPQKICPFSPQRKGLLQQGMRKDG